MSITQSIQQISDAIKDMREIAAKTGFSRSWINGHEVTCTLNRSGHLQWHLDGEIRSGFDVLAFFA